MNAARRYFQVQYCIRRPFSISGHTPMICTMDDFVNSTTDSVTKPFDPYAHRRASSRGERKREEGATPLPRTAPFLALELGLGGIKGDDGERH